MGSLLKLGHHRVRVAADVIIWKEGKYYLMDFEVDAIERPPLDMIMNAIEDVKGARTST